MSGKSRGGSFGDSGDSSNGMVTPGPVGVLESDPTGDRTLCYTNILDRRQLLNQLGDSRHVANPETTLFHSSVGPKFFSHVQEHLAFDRNLAAMERISKELKQCWNKQSGSPYAGMCLYRDTSKSISNCLALAGSELCIGDLHKFLPKKIEIAVKVISMTEVEVKNFTYVTNFSLMMDWTDVTLGDRFEGDSGHQLNFMDHFMPCVEIVNLADGFDENPMLISGRQIPRLKGSQNRVTLTQKYRAKLRCRMDLHRFPFDSQALEIRIQITSVKCGKHRVFMDLAHPHTWRKNHSLDKGWDWLTEWRCSEEEESFKAFLLRRWEWDPSRVPEVLKVKDCFHQKMAVELVIERDSYAMLWNIVFPYLCIELMSLTPYFADFDDLEVRFGTNATMLLSALAFKWMLSDHLPNVSYLTVMDKFVVLGFIMLMFQAVTFCIVATVSEDEDVAKFIDRLSLYMTCSMIISGIVMLWFYGQNRLDPPDLFNKEKVCMDVMQHGWSIKARHPNIAHSLPAAGLVGVEAAGPFEK